MPMNKRPLVAYLQSTLLHKVYSIISSFKPLKAAEKIKHTGSFRMHFLYGDIPKLRWPFFCLFYPPTYLRLTFLLNKHFKQRWHWHGWKLYTLKVLPHSLLWKKSVGLSMGLSNEVLCIITAQGTANCKRSKFEARINCLPRRQAPPVPIFTR